MTPSEDRVETDILEHESTSIGPNLTHGKSGSNETPKGIYWGC